MYFDILISNYYYFVLFYSSKACCSFLKTTQFVYEGRSFHRPGRALCEQNNTQDRWPPPFYHTFSNENNKIIVCRASMQAHIGSEMFNNSVKFVMWDGKCLLY